MYKIYLNIPQNQDKKILKSELTIKKCKTNLKIKNQKRNNYFNFVKRNKTIMPQVSVITHFNKNIQSLIEIMNS